MITSKERLQVSGGKTIVFIRDGRDPLDNQEEQEFVPDFPTLVLNIGVSSSQSGCTVAVK
jgi:hypothetical protein